MSTFPRKISDSTVRRSSLYLRALEALELEGSDTVSSRVLAERVGATAAQVRKDLSLFGTFGTRGLGYEVTALRERLAEILGLSHEWPVALVGAGRIGSALFEYPNFRERGFQIVAILDSDPRKVGQSWDGIEIHSTRELERTIERLGVEIALLAVPASVAQGVADHLVESGVRGILNFAPTRLRVPPGVAVNEVDLALELETLSFVLEGRGRGGNPAPEDVAAGPEGESR